MAKSSASQLGIGDEWFARCQHLELMDLHADGVGVVGKQCGGCLRVFPWRPCAMCGRQTVMREHSKDDWFCSAGCRRQSAAIKAKGGAQ